MTLKDYHVHSTYSDGKNTPEEIILAAINLGMTEIGISDHGYTPFDESYAMKKERLKDYIKEINRLKDKYRDRIKVLCGIEMDYYSVIPTDDFDYVIGSVHYVKLRNKYIEVDSGSEEFIKNIKAYFDGDYMSFCRAYYETLSDVVNKTGADIIGHFDLVTKNNQNDVLFDTSNLLYKNAWKEAADCLLKEDVQFELNTGAISRGYRKEPYPANDIFRYLKSKGAAFILSSDAHKIENLCYMFERYEPFVI